MPVIFMKPQTSNTTKKLSKKSWEIFWQAYGLNHISKMQNPFRDCIYEPNTRYLQFMELKLFVKFYSIWYYTNLHNVSINDFVQFMAAQFFCFHDPCGITEIACLMFRNFYTLPDWHQEIGIRMRVCLLVSRLILGLGSANERRR